MGSLCFSRYALPVCIVSPNDRIMAIPNNDEQDERGDLMKGAIVKWFALHGREGDVGRGRGIFRFVDMSF